MMLGMAGRREPPSSRLELRIVTPDDWRLWREVRLEALGEAPYAFSSTLAEWQSAPPERFRARLAGRSRNLVALLDGRPVGLASGFADGDPGTVDLRSMWVSPTVRGLGTGDALVDAVEAWARERAARRLCLDVVASNTPARRLYERHGLVVTGEVARESPTDPLELRMCKELTHDC
jgi:ribosomal protein S18 acetylase RimI-like enzyme